MYTIENSEEFIIKSNSKTKQTVVVCDSDDDVINWENNADSRSHYMETDSEDTETTSDEDCESNNEFCLATEDNGDWTCDGTCKSFIFKGASGLKDTPTGSNSLQFFELLFDNNFFFSIVKDINNCGIRKKGEKWKILTVPEFKIFLGLLLHTGTIKCSQMQSYWFTNRLFTLTCFAQHMTKKRFHDILLCLHFSSDVNERERNLDKVQPIINYFNDKMKHVYYPNRVLSVEHIVIPRLGSLVFHSNIPEHRSKSDIKLNVLTERSGIAVRIQAYQGCSNSFCRKRHLAKAVLHLLEDFLHKGHSIYLNSSCNSIELASQLLVDQTYCTGMLRKSKKINNTNFINAKFPKKSFISCYRNHIMMGKFRDKRWYSLFISSEFKLNTIVSANKKKKCRTPLAVSKYNAVMNNIKKKNELMSSVTCLRSRFKWFIKLWLHVVETLLLNSFFLCKKYSTSNHKLSFYNYRLKIIETLLFTNHVQDDSSTLQDVKHKLELLPRDKRNKIKRKRCIQCYSKGLKKMANFFCTGCKNKPGLCLGECFHKYHKRFE